MHCFIDVFQVLSVHLISRHGSLTTLELLIQSQHRLCVSCKLHLQSPFCELFHVYQSYDWLLIAVYLCYTGLGCSEMKEVPDPILRRKSYF